MSMKLSQGALEGLSLGQPATVRNLTVFPLLGGEPREPRYRLLADALLSGAVSIAEVSDAGAVPTVRLVNRGDQPVLLLDGEHLIGCKQNRIVNTSVLVAACSELALPVSCVEQGRWSFDSSHFSNSDRAMFSELRAAKAAQVTRNLKSSASHDANQSEIWAGIASKSERLGSDSRSGAMSGIYSRRERDVEDYLAGVELVPGQRGAIFAINGRAVGLEMLDAQVTWTRCFKKVVSGYALDAIDHQTGIASAATSEEARRFVTRVSAGDESTFRGVGLGQDVRLEGQGLCGMALVTDEAVIHLCAFDLATEPHGNSARRVRPWRATDWNPTTDD